MPERDEGEIPDLRERFERYASGREALDDLAAEYGVSGPTLRKRFQEAGYLTPGGTGSRKAYLRRGWSWQDDFWTGEKIIYEDDPAKFVVEGSNGVKITLGELARRNANGESMNSLADELNISPMTLWNYLRDTGLIASPEERQQERRAAALKEVPGDVHDVIVQRYEAGVSVTGIVQHLRKRGLPAKADWVEAVLDHRRIIRHAKAGEIPIGAPEGISATPATQTAELQDPSMEQEAEDPLTQPEGDALPNLDDLSEDVVRMYRDDKEEIASILGYLRLVHGIFASEYKVKRILRDQGVSLRSGPVEQGGPLPSVAVEPRSPVEKSPVEHKHLSEGRLAELAARHAEGGGEPIRILAAREGVDEDDLRRALQEAGYVVSTYTEWLGRKQEG